MLRRVDRVCCREGEETKIVVVVVSVVVVVMVVGVVVVVRVKKHDFTCNSLSRDVVHRIRTIAAVCEQQCRRMWDTILAPGTVLMEMEIAPAYLRSHDCDVRETVQVFNLSRKLRAITQGDGHLASALSKHTHTA